VRGGQSDFDCFDPGVEIRDPLAQQGGDVFGPRRNGGPWFDSGQLRADLAEALAGNHAKFGGMAASGADQWGRLTNQVFAQL
jgi:hypothetical protein